MGVGETIRRLSCKIAIDTNRIEATIAVGNKQLCIGSLIGIEVSVHVTNDISKESKENKDFNLLLVDANNTFNMLNRKHMSCMLRLSWPSASRFIQNIHKGYPMIFAYSSNLVMLNQEGSTQGCRVVMRACGLALSPLFESLLKDNHDNAYADNSSTLGNTENIKI